MTMKGALNHLFDLSKLELIKTQRQLKISFISPCGDNLSGKITHVEQLSPQVWTTCLGKSLKRNMFPDKETA